ncbi:hypothetical protein DCMF_01620 [Candidatus Formimonas warabiya]|uniref:Uncharacterized protein n=2 Tax=Formimonas warabiya TaxID=1761012 RepID=A0A3G1KNH1_FORW1|nr:hypothetical protein DCMF_01620 [Candidatus Formimonas warabiya]
MSKRIEVLTQSLFGYNKKQVDEYLEEISITHQKTINFLRDSIQNCRKEKETLISELNLLKGFNQEGERSQELLELAIKRAVRTISLMNKLAEEDAEKIMEDAKGKVCLHEKKIEDLEQVMAVQRREIDALLNKVKLVSQEGPGIKPEPGEKPADKSMAKIRTAPGQSKNSGSTLEAILNNHEWQKITKVLNKTGKTENILPEAEKITADGYGVSTIRQNSPTFWEDRADDLLTQTAGPLPKLNNVIKLTTASSEEAACGLPMPDTPFCSPSVLEEIERIREKYVVGRIAGADLFDRQKQLIIARNGIITSEVVKKAEKEGKLAELIVNMSMPEAEN